MLSPWKKLSPSSMTSLKYLGFTFDCHGLCSKTAKFIEKLPLKYLCIKKLHLSVLGMKNFFNSYVMSKITFWSQCESYYESEWITANKVAHQFCFAKHNKPRSATSMKSSKASFPISKGGFNICIPSKRTEAAMVSLFFHILQQSP
eukprot:TRINITY_DN152_c0_g3_i4.p1 TRINITY_DN152_c0_g3~~TRINITY_DN152_c0_g3_i4.p1  ORF type:complete len:146 (-),score=5.19 TRINITY_DN152_c0_g3_i4:424-861(-)